MCPERCGDLILRRATLPGVTGGSDHVTFRDKNNIVRVVIVSRQRADRRIGPEGGRGLKGAKATGAPTTLKIGGAPAVKVAYQTTSAPNPVTGKSVTLTVDRYVLAKNGKVRSSTRALPSASTTSTPTA